MSLFDENALREIVESAIRRVVREELTREPSRDRYLPVAEAAEIAGVAPDTIRAWIGQGRLGRYNAGRELRIRRSELDHFLAMPAAQDANGRELSPEEHANQFIQIKMQSRPGTSKAK